VVIGEAFYVSGSECFGTGYIKVALVLTSINSLLWLTSV